MTRILIVITCIAILSSCKTITGSGRIKTEERSVGSFDGIQSSGSIDIEVKRGARQMVELEGDDNILPYVLTTLNNGLLSIRFKSHLSFIDAHVKAYIYTPSLKSIYSSGSADINSVDTLHEEQKLEITVSGSGDIKAIVHSPAIIAHVSGSGSIILQGQTKDLTVVVSSSGDVKCSELKSENADVRLSGSGTAHVFASLRLTATCSGSGDIYYSGHPSSIVNHKSGSGSIQAE